jgi:protein-S-isoprenylcysteine O-methyltransferase Ste14
MTLFVKNLLFTLFVPGTAAVAVPRLLVRGAEPAGPAWAVAAAGLFVAGASGYFWCLWQFARHGRGTPAPIDAPKRLVVRGPYRHVRNPMYESVLLVLLGWTALFRSAEILLYALFVGTAFHLFVVLYEERRLASLFGEDYERYRARVGRWIPRVAPAPGEP